MTYVDKEPVYREGGGGVNEKLEVEFQVEISSMTAKNVLLFLSCLVFFYNAKHIKL